MQVIECCVAWRLHKNVREVVRRGDSGYFDDTVAYVVPDRVVLNAEVLSVRVPYRVLRYTGRGLVVTVQPCRGASLFVGFQESYALQQFAEEDRLLACRVECYVLSVTRRVTCVVLLFRTPGHGTRTKGETVAAD